MWPIVYSILFPGVTLMVVAGLFAFFDFRAYRRKKKRKREKSKRNSSIVFLIMAIFGLCWTIYGSMDLIFKDYVTQEAIYSRYYRGKGIGVREVFFIVGDSENMICAFSSDVRDLEVGKRYKVVYAQRTNMLLSIEEVG